MFDKQKQRKDIKISMTICGVRIFDEQREDPLCW